MVCRNSSYVSIFNHDGLGLRLLSRPSESRHSPLASNRPEHQSDGPLWTPAVLGSSLNRGLRTGVTAIWDYGSSSAPPRAARWAIACPHGTTGGPISPGFGLWDRRNDWTFGQDESLMKTEQEFKWRSRLSLGRAVNDDHRTTEQVLKRSTAVRPMSKFHA